MWHLCVTKDSQYLITASADMTVKVWRVETGEMVYTLRHQGCVRHVELSEGEKMIVTISEPFGSKPGLVSFYDFNPEEENQTDQPKYCWEVPNIPRERKLSRVAWMPLNKNVVTADEAGFLRLHDIQTGKVLKEFQAHRQRINSMVWSKDKIFLMTGSGDNTAKLWDVEDWSCVMTYSTDRNINAVGVSPIKEHVFLGGGQDAKDVTTTSAKVGKFEIKLFHQVFGEEFGTISGHFGPVNALAVHPDGTGFSSGSEDGFIRVHNFDQDYYEFHSTLDDLDALIAAQQEIAG